MMPSVRYALFRASSRPGHTPTGEVTAGQAEELLPELWAALITCDARGRAAAGR